MSKKIGYEFNKLTKPQQDSLALIESLGIYELRALARVFGDNSPTTLKRDDHIFIIMNKIISGEDLRPIPLRQGRPYKELSNIEGILAELSSITGRNYSLKNPRSSSNSNFITFRQAEEDIVKQKLFPIQVSGILRENADNELFFTNEANGKVIFVKNATNSRLEVNDYIVGAAVVMNEQKEYILDSIEYVNFQSYAKYQGQSNPYTTALPEQTIYFADHPILLGSRYMLTTTKFADKIDQIKPLLTQLKLNKIFSIALIPNVLPEDELQIHSLGFNNVKTIKYDEKPETALNILSCFIDNIQRMQNLGYKLAIFVEDLSTLANIASQANSDASIMKQIVMLAKSGGKDKHTTLFTTLDETDLFDKNFVSSVYKVSKKIEL